MVGEQKAWTLDRRLLLSIQPKLHLLSSLIDSAQCTPSFDVISLTKQRCSSSHLESVQTSPLPLHAAQYPNVLVVSWLGAVMQQLWSLEDQISSSMLDSLELESACMHTT